MAAILATALTSSASAQTAHLLGATSTLGSGFNNPGGVAVDGAGNVYVADTSNNAVKKIPYSGGSYGTPVTLGSGFNQPGGVAVDGAGNVYVADSGNNAVKKIPYSGGSYGTPVTLGSGFNQPGGVAVDGAGNVYVADTDSRAVKKIPYSGGSYGTPVTLGSGFSIPEGVAVDGAGNVYVADAGNDAIKKIPYSGGSYGTPVTLGGGFNEPFGVAVDGAGNVYVADTANNAVKKVPYSGGSYGTPVTLGSGFQIPYGVAVDGAGNVYVADTFNNLVKKIETTIDFGAANTGASASSQTIVFSIDTAGTLGTPAVLTQGAPSLDYTYDSTSTCKAGAVTAGATCTVVVDFKPTSPGARYGAVQLVSSTGTLLATAYLTGTGTGPQMTFPPGQTPVTLGSGFSYPYGVAVDGAGNVFVADTDNSAVKKIPYSGGSYGTPVKLGSGFSQPYGVAVDGAGNVYVADTLNNAVKEIPYSGGSYGTPVTLGSGFQIPYGVAVDGAGNVYVADTNNNAVKKIPYSGGSYGTPVTLGSGFSQPYGVAVDGAGNVYVTDSGNNAVKMIPYSGGSYGTPVTLGSGFNEPFGVTVDGAGNVYVADTNNNAVKEIPYSGGSYGAPVTLGSGFNGPLGVAVDGAGNLYVADTDNNAVKKIDLSTPPTVSFADTTIGNTSATQTLTLQNAGNSALTFPIPAVGSTNPAVGSGFNITNSSTCPELTSSSGSAGTLAAGTSCTYVLNYQPVISGAVSRFLTLTDNSMNVNGSTQNVVMTGSTGGDGVAVQNAAATHGSTAVPLSFAVGYGGNTLPTGTPTLTVNGSATGVGTITCIAKAGHNLCTTTYNASGLPAGPYTITATQPADSTYSQAVGTGTLTITASGVRRPKPILTKNPVDATGALLNR